MRNIMFLLLALGLTACNQQFGVNQNDPRTISGIDPEFNQYVNKYIQYKGRGLDYDIPIQFADLEGTPIGLCSKWTSGHRQIQIDQPYWDKITKYGETYPEYAEGIKLELIAHELGHCDLGLSHNENKVNNVPVSIMYPYVFVLTYQDESYYMNELFNFTSIQMSVDSQSINVREDILN